MPQSASGPGGELQPDTDLGHQGWLCTVHFRGRWVSGGSGAGGEEGRGDVSEDGGTAPCSASGSWVENYKIRLTQLIKVSCVLYMGEGKGGRVSGEWEREGCVCVRDRERAAP